MKRELFVGSACATLAALTTTKSNANGSERLPLRDWVVSATLAASAHNAQPWVFTGTDSGLELYADRKRTLGPADPYLREMYMGLGCALENLSVAAAAAGYQTFIRAVPADLTQLGKEPIVAPVARVDFEKVRSPDSSTTLAEAIPHRHTNRSPYKLDRMPPRGFTRALEGMRTNTVTIFLFEEDFARRVFTEVFAETTQMYRDRRLVKGLKRWERTKAELRELRDGILVGAGPNLSPSELIRTVPLMGIIAVRNPHDAREVLSAGRLWQRTHLLATTFGIAGRPETSPIQFMDWSRVNAKKTRSEELLAGLTGTPDWHAALLFCVGYATLPSVPTPRRPVDDVFSQRTARTSTFKSGRGSDPNDIAAASDSKRLTEEIGAEV